MLDMPNIRHLRVFREVIELKSISKASRKVYLSQPAITQAISKLEASLNTQLFLRKNNGMHASESGTLFAFRVNRALQLLQTGLESALAELPQKDTSLSNKLLAQVSTTQLRALVAVVEARNFSVAGKNLGVSQSSVHRAARDLENLLAIDLFEKTSIGISPCPAAQTLTKASKLAQAEISQGIEEVDALHSRATGKIVVGSMPLARSAILPKAIIEFSKDLPAYNITVNDGPYADLLYHLRNGDIDLLIGALRDPCPADDIQQETLFQSSLAIISSPDHPLQSAKNITANELAHYPWIVPRGGAPTRKVFDDIFINENIKLPTKIIESGSQALSREILKENEHLCIYSKDQVQFELDSNSFRAIPYTLKNASRPIGFAHRKDWKPTSRQALFIEQLRTQNNRP